MSERQESTPRAGEQGIAQVLLLAGAALFLWAVFRKRGSSVGTALAAAVPPMQLVSSWSPMP